MSQKFIKIKTFEKYGNQIVCSEDGKWINCNSYIESLSKYFPDVHSSTVLSDRVIAIHATTEIKNLDEVPDSDFVRLWFGWDVGKRYKIFFYHLDEQKFLDCIFRDQVPNEVSGIEDVDKVEECPHAQTTSNAVDHSDVCQQEKIYLSNKIRYTGIGVIKKKRVNIEQDILASDPDENGARWLSLCDVIQMFTGKNMNAVVRYVKENETRFSGFSINTNNIYTLKCKNVWRLTPAIRSTDLKRLGIELNSSVRKLSSVCVENGDSEKNKNFSTGLNEEESEKNGKELVQITKNKNKEDSNEVPILDNIFKYENVEIPASKTFNGVRFVSFNSLYRIFRGNKTNPRDYIYNAEFKTKFECVVSNDALTTLSTPSNSECHGKIMSLNYQSSKIRYIMARYKPYKTREQLTPAIRSTDILLVGSLLNPSIAKAASVSLTRVIGGDLTLIDEVVENRAKQEILAEEDPNNITRVAGEIVENNEFDKIDIPTNISEDRIEERKEEIKEELNSGIDPQEVMRGLRGPKIDVKKMIKAHLPPSDAKHAIKDLGRGMTRNCFYTLYFPPPKLTTIPKELEDNLKKNGLDKYPKSRMVIVKQDAPRGFIKVGFSDQPVIRFETLFRSFSAYADNVKILRCEEMGKQAEMLETRILQSLREKGVMPDKPESNVFAKYKPGIGCKNINFVPTPFCETFKVTESFGIPELDTLIETSRSQLGVPVENDESEDVQTSKYPGLDNDQILELEKFRIEKELENEIERIKIDKKERQDLLDKLSPEDRFKLIEKMLLG